MLIAENNALLIRRDIFLRVEVGEKFSEQRAGLEGVGDVF
jgi:hypothetical protein